MIDERELERLLDVAGRAEQPPPDGPAAVVARAGVPPRPARSVRRRPLLAVGAAAVVAVAVVAGALVLDRAGTERRALTSAEGDVAPGGGGQPSTTIAPSDAALGAATETDGVAAPSAPPAPAPAPAPGIQPRVVKTGEVDLEVADGRFGPAVERVAALATGAGGFVSATTTLEQSDTPSGSITIRVPAARFEDILTQVRRLGEVRAVTSNGQDVTAQYTDLEARLAALGLARQRLLDLLGRAEAIPDILAVQDRLNATQVEIESLEGQRRVLDDQTSFGTIAVTLAEPGAEDAIVFGDDDGLGRAWDDAVDGFSDGVEWLVAASGPALLVGLCLAAVFGVFRLSRSALRRRLL